MLHFFYKYPHRFYLSSTMYENILKKYDCITTETIKDFLKKQFDLKKSKITVEKITEYLLIVTIRFKEENKQRKFKELTVKNNELFPPWKIFPNYLEQYISWDQGVQYDYCVKNWLPFWRNLSEKQKNDYRIKYECSNDWKNWLDENNNVL